MNEISVVIPAYNESAIIVGNLKKINNYLRDVFPKYEIIVVDDGSQDDTAKKAANLQNVNLVSYTPNRGKGHAVRKGVLLAKYDYILFMDADLATPIEEIENLQAYVDNYDIVIASRALPESKIKQKQPLIRSFLGATGKKIIQMFLIKGIKDTQCGFKLFKKDVARALFKEQKINRWGFDFELLFLAQKMNYRIKEVPIVWYSMIDSKLKMTDYIVTLFDLIKVRLRYLITRPDKR